jgi:endonuclease YncB( thermonuclease family)
MTGKRSSALTLLLLALLLALTAPALAPAAEFHGYPCLTLECSGHHAGYDWAEREGITDPEDCSGNSQSFIEGCRAWADALPAGAQERPAEFHAQVLRVSDGDTLVVQTAAYEQIKVRLYGIDAPESKQEGGAEATAALKQLPGQTVTVIEMDTDRYSRMVALIEHGGRSVNLELVQAGHAWHYAKYCKAEPICGRIQVAEAEARAAKRGLWAGEEPMPPWEWRQGRGVKEGQ